MAKAKAQLQAEQELKGETITESTTQTREVSESDKDIKAIMESVGTIAKEMKALNEKWDKDMEKVKSLAKAGRF